MKQGIYFILLMTLYGSLFGCGSSSGTASSEPVGKDIIAANNLEIQGQPTTTVLELPLQFTEANWGQKEELCQQAGYDLVPFAGQTVSLIQYSITDQYYHPSVPGAPGEPLYLWIIAKDKTSICGYITVREGSGLTPGVMPVNDPNVR